MFPHPPTRHTEASQHSTRHPALGPCCGACPATGQPRSTKWMAGIGTPTSSAV